MMILIVLPVLGTVVVAPCSYLFSRLSMQLPGTALPAPETAAAVPCNYSLSRQSVQLTGIVWRQLAAVCCSC